MEFDDVVRRRRMVRAYTDQPVPPAVLDAALQHAIRAPSAGFTQGWDFLVLTSAPDRARFWQVCRDPERPKDGWLTAMMSAPALIVCLSSKQAYLRRYAEADKGWVDEAEARWPVPYWHVDTGMAALLMLLTAVDRGLAGCFFGLPGERVTPFRAAFDVPADREPVGVVSLGYPAPDRRSASLRRGRKSVEEVAHLGRFGVPYRTSSADSPSPDSPSPDSRLPGSPLPALPSPGSPSADEVTPQ